MNESALIAETESILELAYKDESARYGRALELLKESQWKLEHHEECDVLLNDFVAEINEVRRIETGIARAKTIWQTSNQAPNPRLKAAMDEVADLLKQLIDRSQIAEKTASIQLSGLAPQLDSATRGQQMHRAYSRVMSDALSDRALDDYRGK